MKFWKRKQTTELPIFSEFYMALQNDGLWDMYDTALASKPCSAEDCRVFKNINSKEEARLIMMAFDMVRKKKAGGA